MSQAWNLLKAQPHMTTIRDENEPPGEYPQSIDPNVASMTARYKGRTGGYDLPSERGGKLGEDAFQSNQHNLDLSTGKSSANDTDWDQHYKAKQNMKAAKNKEYGKNPIATDPNDISGGNHFAQFGNSAREGGNQAINDIRSRVQRMPRPGERGGGDHEGLEDTSQTKEQEPQDPYDARNYNMGYDPQLQQGQQQQQLGQRSPLQLQAPQQ